MHKQPKSAPELSYEKENPEIIFHYLNVVSGFPTNTKHLRITSITMSNINKIGLQNVSNVCLICDILSALLLWAWKLYKPDR